MSFQVRFRKLLGATVSKPDTSSDKSDLRLLWEQATTPTSSPEPKNRSAPRRDNLLTLLSTATPSTPTKKLYCPPRVQEPKEEKPKEERLDFAYSMVSVTSTSNVTIPEPILDSRFFVFRSGENRLAWESFKTSVKRARFALVSIVNIFFLFENGNARAKAVTGTANQRLASLSSRLPYVEADAVLSFVDERVEKERLTLYSTEMFDFSTVTPISKKSCEMQSASGMLQRVTLSGCIFSPLLAEIEAANPGAKFAHAVLKL